MWEAVTAARHAVELAHYRMTRSQHHRADLAALAKLERVPVELPVGLELEWLGVAGYRLTFEGQTLLIDPFVSRFPIKDLVLRRTVLPDPERIAAFDPRGKVVGIACGHAHWDHSLDAPAFARRFGCAAYGSTSLANQMALHGLAGQAVTAEPYYRYQLGPFEVSFTPSVHSKLVLGLSIPMDGDTDATSLEQMSAPHYKCGQTWGIRIAVAGIVIYHQGSADLVDDAVRDRDVDIFLAGIAGRNFTPNYWERVLTRLRPKTVVPMHYDDFFATLEDPIGFLPQTNLAWVADEIRAVLPDVTVAALPRFGVVA
ncbi:MBL fold metallo-hydrolase [Smaragdicoccus niigatensis]|uniref:MBL fold metallo-hydrolase n=1 Tax=Smaragdicoccus niigatensis TaxID=359359 RepID=UPI0003673D1E|nr:MBL fold metallo-hydrolase [Smaragdicoccus niigatensis]